MKHLIMGTAGHIDHGKTALIKALTNIECDTHKEEKIRGITINLGFAHIELPNGQSIGIIDVPGHKDFVNTMVAGASGIDFVMLVIAADSGIMPQTVEHLNVMKILGIKKGFVALTKIDLVDEELLKIVEQEVADFIKGTFLEEFPIIKVSSKTGYGIEELKQLLVKISEEIPQRPTGDVFRMYIDRIFTVKGFGTVVNGSVISGKLRDNEKVYLLPNAKKLRIRRMERHGTQVEEITAGDRASLNLIGLNKENFSRGMLISNMPLQTTDMIDAKITLFNHNSSFGRWSQAIFLLGTLQAQAKIHLIDKEILKPRQSGIVQIHLDSPCIAFYGDKFVLRNTSSELTLGGGIVLDAHPLHHRRRNENVINKLYKIASGDISELIATEVRKSLYPLNYEYIAKKLNLPEEKIREIIFKSIPEDISILSSDKNIFLFKKEEKSRTEKRILENLKEYHKKNPFLETGKTFKELVGLFGMKNDSSNDKWIQIIMKKLEDEGKIKQIQNTWALKTHKLNISKDDEKQIAFVENYFKNSGMKTPLLSDLCSIAEKKGYNDKKIKQIIGLLINKGKLCNIDGNFIHSSVINGAREKLLKYLNDNPQGIKISEFRDLIEGNRKICLLMLTQFDSEGITIRKGDYRVITEKGYKEIGR